MLNRIVFTDEMIDAITSVVRRGNSAEIKKENNKIVIVEVSRNVKNKTSAIG